MRELAVALAVALLSVTAPAMQRGDDAVSKTALVREDIVIPPAPDTIPMERHSPTSSYVCGGRSRMEAIVHARTAI